MGILTEDMKRVLREQRLGFFATVCPDGTANLSPKGTTLPWDDDHLIFANIRSPRTLANLRINASFEVNVVDPIVRKGYRFKGTATILKDGPVYDAVLRFYRDHGVSAHIGEIVLAKVDRAAPLISPAYDSGLTENEVIARWEQHFASLRNGRST